MKKDRATIKFVEEYKEKKRLSYEDLARRSGSSREYWPQMKRRNTPPSRRYTETLIKNDEMNEKDGRLLLNLLLYDVVTSVLEKHGFDSDPPTPEIANFINTFNAWTNMLVQNGRYIMLTKRYRPGIEFASDISVLRENEDFLRRRVLKSVAESRLAA